MSDYPSDEDLKLIADWGVKDCDGLIRFVRSIWHWPEMATMEGGMLRLATGGWSGNEDIVMAMRDNDVFWMLCWQSSARGGLHWFKPWQSA